LRFFLPFKDDHVTIQTFVFQIGISVFYFLFMRYFFVENYDVIKF